MHRSGGVYAECRFRVRANIWHEVLGLREARHARTGSATLVSELLSANFVAMRSAEGK